MRPVRNSVKAIIIKDGKLLATKNKDDWGVYYLLPGGGQEPYENLRETLKRECMEEISVRVEIGDILLIREYIGKNHKFAEWDGELHQIEFMFECRLLNENELENGNVPDDAQIGFEWLNIESLAEYRIYPAALKDYLGVTGKKTDKVYMGDVF